MATTFRSSVAGPLLPALEVRSPLTFMCVPSVDEVTSTSTKQLRLLPTLPLLNVMVPPPSGAETRPPVQVVVG